MLSLDAIYKSAYWRAFRLQVFERDDWRCVFCNSPEELDCHHRNYERKGKEELRDCYTLCRECHDVVTNHQRDKRYTTRELPPVQEVGAPEVVYMFGSSYRKISIETDCQVSSDQGGTALDAKWAIERPAERMDEAQEENYGKTQENGLRLRGSRSPRMDGQPLSVQWGAMHSARSGEGDHTER